jgi:hypothetical protein
LYSNSIDLFIEQIFVGFGLLMLLISSIIAFIPEKFAKYINTFRTYAIKTIRIAGILGLLWFVIYMILAASSDTRMFEHLFDTSRNGYERLAILLLLIRFPLLFGLTQLLWLKKVQARVLYRNLIAVFTIFVALLHGRFLEKFIGITSFFYRDYLPSSYTIFDDNAWQQLISAMYKSCTLFAIFVLIFWGISTIINRLKRHHV